eukprot:4577048-Alexandrium_andersonii.AAC.1
MPLPAPRARPWPAAPEAMPWPVAGALTVPPHGGWKPLGNAIPGSVHPWSARASWFPWAPAARGHC